MVMTSSGRPPASSRVAATSASLMHVTETPVPLHSQHGIFVPIVMSATSPFVVKNASRKGICVGSKKSAGAVPAGFGDADREGHGEGHARRQRAEAGMVRLHHLEPHAAHLGERRKRRIRKRDNGYAAPRHGPRLRGALCRIGRKAHR